MTHRVKTDMTLRLRQTASAATFLMGAAIPVLSAAQTAESATPNRWYGTIYLGASSVSDADATLSGSGPGKLRLGSGETYGGAIGRRIGNDFRVEGEISYRSNKIKSTSVPGLNSAQTDADYAALFLMVNGYYDFPELVTSFAKFRPYVGAGIGRAQEVDTDLQIGGAQREFSGSKTASQLLAGVNWDYNSRWSAGIGIRYTNAGKVKLEGTGATAGQTLTADYKGTTLIASVGYRF